MMLTMTHNHCANYSLMGACSIVVNMIPQFDKKVKKIFLFLIFAEFIFLHIYKSKFFLYNKIQKQQEFRKAIRCRNS